jgi:hypothetical protein
MPSAVQLQLGGPLFLTTLIIANAQGHAASATCKGAGPPRVQSVMFSTAQSSSQALCRSRGQEALAAIHIAASFLRDAGVRAPAGVCPDRRGPSCLSKLPTWLGQVAALSGSAALVLLAEHARCVPPDVWQRVEAEYNDGVNVARCQGTSSQQDLNIDSNVGILLAENPNGERSKLMGIPTWANAGIGLRLL